MDYKEYYSEIKDKLDRFSDVVYFIPMSNEELLDFEKQIGQTIKPLYREYLLTFGMVQDAFEKLTTCVETFMEDFNFIKDSLKGYLPLFSEIGDEVTTFIINNKDLDDDFVYCFGDGNNDKIGKIRKVKPFQKYLEESISMLNTNHKKRCPNTKKVNNTEFRIAGKDFSVFCKLFKEEGLKKLTPWKQKYYPINIFGTEVAKFLLYDKEIIIEKDEDQMDYNFEIEEPILTDREKSLIRKTEQLLKFRQIEFDKIECTLIETE